MRFIAGPPEMGGEIVKDTGGFSYRIPPEPIWRKIWRIVLGILREVWSKRHNPIQFFSSMIKAAGQLVVLFLVVFAKTFYATIAATAVWLAQKTIKGVGAIKRTFQKMGSRISKWWKKPKRSEEDELPEHIIMFWGVPVEKRFLWYGVGGLAIITIMIIATYYWVKPFMWWILAAVGVVTALVVIYYAVKPLTSGSSEETGKKAKEIIVWALCLTVGLGMIHWLLWNLDQEFWESVWANKSRFWAINLALLSSLLLLSLTKGVDGKPHTLTTPFLWMSKGIAVLAVSLIVMSLWDFMAEGKDWSLWAGRLGDITSRTRTRVDNRSHSVPMEVALAVIADCESGGGVPGGARHFEDDGKTPLKNKEGSTAVGKYQILTSMHEERAKKMGFDIRTEAGNEAYARVLYQESGTRHWEADKRSVACWEPRLRAYTWGGEAVTLVVSAPNDRWSEKIDMPRNGKLAGTSHDGFGKKYKVLYNETVEERFPRQKDAPAVTPNIVYSMRFQSEETGKAPITVKFH